MKRPRHTLAAVAVLLALWLLAWGEISPARIIAGILVAIGLLVVFPPEHRPDDLGPLRIHPVAALRLVAYVLGQLVTSNILVAREILTPGSNVHTGVLSHPLGDVCEETMSLVANIIALTPGTMTVELTRDPNILYVHFLLLDDLDAARASIARLETLVTATISRGTPASTTTPAVESDPAATTTDPDTTLATTDPAQEDHHP